MQLRCGLFLSCFCTPYPVPRGCSGLAVTTLLLPADMEPVTDGPPHGIVPALASQEEQGLCERCQTLGIGAYLEKSGQVQVGRFATITKSSLESDCHFCQLFCSILSTADQSEGLADMYQFDLWREFTRCLDREGCQNEIDLFLYTSPDRVCTPKKFIEFYPEPISRILRPDSPRYDLDQTSLAHMRREPCGGMPATLVHEQYLAVDRL